MIRDGHQFGASIAVLPGNPPEPCPEVLTAQEAVRYLRLDVGGTKHPADTLRYYRESGLLTGVRVCWHMRFSETRMGARR